MTVSRLRLIQETRSTGKALGRLNVTDKDMARITGWIEDDAVTQDVYQDRLNALLDLGSQSDKDSLEAAGLSQAGQELMNIWSELDRGGMRQDDAFAEADRAVRRRSASADGEV
jgi:hypothetical protein